MDCGSISLSEEACGGGGGGLVIGKCGSTQIVNLPMQLPNGEICWQTVQLTAVEPISELCASSENNKAGEEVCTLSEQTEILVIQSEDGSGNASLGIMSPTATSGAVPCADYLASIIASNSSNQEAPVSVAVTEDDSGGAGGPGEKRRRQVCTCPNCVLRGRRRRQRTGKFKHQGEGGVSGDQVESPRKPSVVVHLCPYSGCSKTYQKTSHLRSHILSQHSGDRPYECTWKGCPRAFTRSDELARHLRTHTGDSRFECGDCGKTFTRKDHLNKHCKSKRCHTASQQQQSSSLGNHEVEELPVA